MTVRMGYVPRRSDASAHQRGRNAGVRFPGRNDIREKRQKPPLFSNHVRTAKNSLFLCRCLYHSAIRRTAHTVRRSVCLFIESQKVKRSSKNDRCPLRTGVHGRQFQRMAVHDKTTLCGIRLLPFSTSIIPQSESKKGKEL